VPKEKNSKKIFLEQINHKNALHFREKRVIFSIKKQI